MLYDSQMQPQDLEDLRFLPDIMVPPQHSGDPFACPCCANVFAETARIATNASRNITISGSVPACAGQCQLVAPPREKLAKGRRLVRAFDRMFG